MKLLVEELDVVAVKQEISVGDFPLNVEAIRPHIYKHNAPAGSVFVEVQDENFKPIALSNSITITDISASAFFHGVVRFDINVGLRANTNYWVELKTSGYTFNESAYIGWCKDYDLRKITADYSPNIGFDSAMILEIWSREQFQRGSKIA